jgi:hypothetical protein
MREIRQSGSVSAVWKRSHGRASEAPPDERGGNRYVRPTATAPHLGSTQLSRSRRLSRMAGMGAWAAIAIENRAARRGSWSRNSLSPIVWCGALASHRQRDVAGKNDCCAACAGSRASKNSIASSAPARIDDESSVRGNSGSRPYPSSKIGARRAETGSSHARARDAQLPKRPAPATCSGRWQARRSNEHANEASVSPTAA